MLDTIQAGGNTFTLPASIGTGEMLAETSKRLSLAMQAMNPVRKDHANPAFRSRYAGLGAVLETISDALGSQNLALMTSEVSLAVGVVKMAFYVVDGENGSRLLAGLSSPYEITKNPKINDAQAIGSAETYAIRRGAMQVFGLATEDDDANGARPSSPPAQQQRPAAPPAQGQRPPATAPAKPDAAGQEELAEKARAAAVNRCMQTIKRLGFGDEVSSPEGNLDKEKCLGFLRKLFGKDDLPWPSKAEHWKAAEERVRDYHQQISGGGDL